MRIKSMHKFLKGEPGIGLLIITSGLLALLCTNSPLSYLYDLLLATPVEVRVGSLLIAKPLLLWINDGLMAIFFLLVGLEIKREIMVGRMASFRQVVLPAAAAIGGMIIPALVYIVLNSKDPVSLNGWAIPAATDIAFALGVLAMLGERVPPSLKLFLLAVAVLDDIGAIVIIALFYSGDLSLLSLLIAVLALGVLILLNRMKVARLAPYVLVGIVLWVCVLKSGVHATLAGVALAFTIPLKAGEGKSPLTYMEHSIHPYVYYGIVPIFAFANAGVSLEGLSFNTLLEPVPLGIAAGLFLGKQLGVYSFSRLAVKFGVANLPADVTWPQLHGVALLCGIGFTMSLFIGSLAFEHGGPDYKTAVRIGVLAGSILSGIVGYLYLRHGLKSRA